MTICREFIGNKLSVDRFRQLLGIDPIPFWSSSLRLCGYDWQQSHNCRDDWMRYTWQKPGNLNHEDLELAISQAEDEIERLLGFPVGPTWVCERHTLISAQGNKTNRFKIDLPYVTAFGQRNTQHIATVDRVADPVETTKIQPHWAVHHSEYQMTWETPEHRLWEISINGTVYDVNALNITHKADLQRWLNGLGLGIFFVTIDDPITAFTDTDYSEAPIPTIEAPNGVTIDYIITYSHAERYRNRIEWVNRWDGHVIDSTFYDTPTLGFTTKEEIKLWADGLGLGIWEVYNNYGNSFASEPPILLIPDKPSPFFVYGCSDVTSDEVMYKDLMVIDTTFYDNTAIAGDVVAQQAFLTGLGYTSYLTTTVPQKVMILNPLLTKMYYCTEANQEPVELFGIILDDVVSTAVARPFSYYLEDNDSDGYFENAVITGSSYLPEKTCEIEVYATGSLLTEHVNKLCRIRPVEFRTFNNGDFIINIPSYLLINNVLLDKRVAPYSDPFPIDLCCNSEDTECDPESFYLETLELWRIWHDNTLPSIYFRGNSSCNITEPCRSNDITGCANLEQTTNQWVKPYGSEYHTVYIPDNTSRFNREHDGWQIHGCPRYNIVDIYYYFDPCDSSCHNINCTGDVCKIFERAVFMLAAARLWDLCPCGCEDNRLKTFQREISNRNISGTYDVSSIIVGGPNAKDLNNYPFGTRYGEVEAWRLLKNYMRFSDNIGSSVL